MADNPKQFDDKQWKARLTAEQYRVLRQKETEMPGTGRLLHNDRSGDYLCAACGARLFTSQDKYETTTPGLVGWPSFADVVDGAVELRNDESFIMHRVEVICRRCGSHLGHLFHDLDSPSGQHYCINSVALNFEEEKA